MRLSDYFQQQKSQTMSSKMKSHIFSNIQKNKWIEFSTKLPSKFLFFASKKILYSSLATFLCVVVFWWMLLDRTNIVDFWTFLVQKNTNPNGVLADYVAEIIEFNGEYSLIRNWENIENTQVIWNGDNVKLKDGTDLVFSLNDGTQAKIVWPAEFSITRYQKWYQLSLVDWKFFRMYCPECESEIDIITPDVSIHQEKGQSLDVHIAKDSTERMLVKNDGDALKVIRSNDKTKSETEIQATKLVAIASNQEVVNVLSDSDLMEKFMEENSITSTFSISSKNADYSLDKALTMNLSGNKQKKPAESRFAQEKIKDSVQTWSDIAWSGMIEVIEEEVEPINVKDLKEVESRKDEDLLLAWILEVISSDIVVTGSITDMSEDLLSDLWLSEEGELNMPSQQQIDTIKKKLNGFFLMNIFESIYVQDRVDKNIEKFADRVNAVAAAFNYPDRADSDLHSIKSLINTLEERLQEERYISPSYILQLHKLSNRCDELISHANDQSENLQEQRDNFVSNPSVSFRLM